jgi:hypothetical protein
MSTTDGKQSVTMEHPKPNCLRRFRKEFSLPFFELEEEGYGTLDMRKNLNMGAGILSIAGMSKLFLLGLSTTALISDAVHYVHGIFFLAFLTRWTVLVHVFYLLMSLLVTALPTANTTTMMKLAWAIFPLAFSTGIIVTLMYWLAVWEPSWGADFRNTMTHGGIALCVTLDGYLVNRTPVRIKHVIVSMTYAFAYTIWSILQNTVFQYNPEWDDDDDAIYDIIKWRTNTTEAITITCGLIFVVIPSLHFIAWAISLPIRHFEEKFGVETEPAKYQPEDA